jgi:large subunit ribosomal protein L22
MAPRAIQRGVRQSARKMRLVMDTIRHKNVNEAYALLHFSKKYAARQIEKVLRSAVSNAEQDAQKTNAAFDVDQLVVSYAIVNEGQTLKRFSSAALGRATPIHKRTSIVEIRVAAKEDRRAARRDRAPVAEKAVAEKVAAPAKKRRAPAKEKK